MKSADEKPYRSTRFVTLEPTAASPHPRFNGLDVVLQHDLLGGFDRGPSSASDSYLI
jgi:hypothetical protein